MPSESSETKSLIRRVEAGDAVAMTELFARYRDRLEVISADAY